MPFASIVAMLKNRSLFVFGYHGRAIRFLCHGKPRLFIVSTSPVALVDSQNPVTIRKYSAEVENCFA